MSFKKSISWILIASQMSLGVSLASADTSAPQAPAAPSPELTLVENVVALQGQGFSQSDLQNQMSALMSHYFSSAPAAGSQQRFEQALVELGIYTPAQAEAYVKDANAASQKADNPQAMEAAVNDLASLHPAGAQFSLSDTECSAADVGAVLGAVVASVGAWLYMTAPVCPSADVVSHGWAPATCSDTNLPSHPYGTAGESLMIGGGVLLLVGGLVYLLTLTGNGCDS